VSSRLFKRGLPFPKFRIRDKRKSGISPQSRPIGKLAKTAACRISGDTIPILLRAQAFPASNKVRGLRAHHRFSVASNSMQTKGERRVILRSASRPTGNRFVFFGNPDEKAQRFIHRVRRGKRFRNVGL